MKAKHACILSLTAGGLVLVSGCVVEPNGQLAFQPLVIAPAPVIEAPPPVVVAPEPVVEVPDSYVWDGVEYVGVVGGQYFYLGPDNVWLVCDPVRLERFHGWERYHPDWRTHAIHNDRFRNARNEHVQPGHGEPRRAAPKKKKDEH
jgi:hypothetical protein